MEKSLAIPTRLFWHRRGHYSVYYPTDKKTFDLFEDTYIRYPKLLIEKDWVRYLLANLVFFPLYFLQFRLGLFPNLWLSLSGAAFYVAGGIYDIYTTNEVFKIKVQFDERHLNFPIVEGNKFLPPFPNLQQIIFKRTLIFTMVLFPIAIIFPGFGVGFGLARYLVGLANLRNKKRVLLVLRMIKGIRYSEIYKAWGFAN